MKSLAVMDLTWVLQSTLMMTKNLVTLTLTPRNLRLIGLTSGARTRSRNFFLGFEVPTIK